MRDLKLFVGVLLTIGAYIAFFAAPAIVANLFCSGKWLEGGLGLLLMLYGLHVLFTHTSGTLHM